jgi:hypothetical protein
MGRAVPNEMFHFAARGALACPSDNFGSNTLAGKNLSDGS